jgi:hypothetical protein
VVVTVAAVTVPLTACACTVGTTDHTRTWVVKKSRHIFRNFFSVSVKTVSINIDAIQALKIKARNPQQIPRLREAEHKRGGRMRNIRKKHMAKLSIEAQHRSTASKHREAHAEHRKGTSKAQGGTRTEAQRGTRTEAQRGTSTEAHAWKHTHGSTRMEAHAYRGSAQQHNDDHQEKSTVQTHRVTQAQKHRVTQSQKHKHHEAHVIRQHARSLIPEHQPCEAAAHKQHNDDHQEKSTVQTHSVTQAQKHKHHAAHAYRRTST